MLDDLTFMVEHELGGPAQRDSRRKAKLDGRVPVHEGGIAALRRTQDFQLKLPAQPEKALGRCDQWLPPVQFHNGISEMNVWMVVASEQPGMRFLAKRFLGKQTPDHVEG